jgi:hypothetical protein
MKHMVTNAERLEKFEDCVDVVIAYGIDYLLRHYRVGTRDNAIGVTVSLGFDSAMAIYRLFYYLSTRIGEELFGTKCSVIEFILL